MAELAVITKRLDFRLEQVQDFTPTPMTIATEMWYTGYNPYTLERVFSAKTQQEKLAQRQFFFWYKPEERNSIEKELRRIGRADLISELYSSPRPQANPTDKRTNEKRTSKKQGKDSKANAPWYENRNVSGDKKPRRKPSHPKHT